MLVHSGRVRDDELVHPACQALQFRRSVCLSELCGRRGVDGAALDGGDPRFHRVREMNLQRLPGGLLPARWDAWAEFLDVKAFQCLDYVTFYSIVSAFDQRKRTYGYVQLYGVVFRVH